MAIKNIKSPALRLDEKKSKPKAKASTVIEKTKPLDVNSLAARLKIIEEFLGLE